MQIVNIPLGIILYVVWIIHESDIQSLCDKEKVLYHLKNEEKIIIIIIRTYFGDCS